MWRMAYDEELAQRVREQLAEEHAITEKAMFGGLAFLLHGNMAIGLTDDELMVRLGPDGADEALAEPYTRPFDMSGRPMRGWILVDGAGLQSEEELAAWIGRGIAFADSLPPKT
jgi:TfoX/Sxy family transcriptional regulator of competence genes